MLPALLLAAAAAVAAAGVAPPTAAAATHGSGDGTYYGSAVNGACSLYPRPLQYAGRRGVALAAASYGGASLCGACLSVTSTGRGSGANPLPRSFDAYVMDLCPTCPGRGDLDVATPGDGRWDVSWKVVDCPVVPGGPALYLQGSNDWYVKAQVRNVARPIAWVSIGGAPARRTHDHFWMAANPGGRGWAGRVAVSIGLAGGRVAHVGTIPIRSGVVLRGTKGRRGGGTTPATPARRKKGGRGGRRGGGGGHRRGGCAGLWGQCGGARHAGPTCCARGTACRRFHPWYSQCRPAGGGRRRRPRRQCAGLWGQCGGQLHAGPTCCARGTVCRRFHPWYSQCRPARRWA